MRILYDYQIMLMQKYGGVSRGFCEVASILKECYKQDVEFVSEGSQNYYLQTLFGVKSVKEIEDDCIRKNQMTVLEKCVSGRYDILHSTWYHPYLYDVAGCKHVITIHDMVQECYPLYLENRSFVECKKRLIESADAIIAVSRHTKEDIIKVYPHISSDKVFVVHQGGKKEYRGTMSAMDVPQKYLLYVGARGGYKNFETFVVAAEKVMKKDSDIHLVCVGGGEFTPQERRMVYDIKDKVLHVHATDEQLEYLYRHAKAFVFPSKYEGFGIPIIEAFSYGCPVVLSDASCFPEIATDAAVYFDPNNVDSMVDSIERILSDRILRNEKVHKGLLRAEDFSWANSAANMHKAYEQILQG